MSEDQNKAKSRIFLPSVKVPMNVKLEELEKAREVKRLANEQEAALQESVAKDLNECVVVFVDMVGSTKFKQEHADEPAVWIRRVQLFSETVRDFITDSKGVVVKYIGDEVMAVFDRPLQIDDALGFVLRIKSLQDYLHEVTDEPTSVKIAIDSGPVALLEFEGHQELDPQGSAIDRCARVAKYAEAGTVVTTENFVNRCPEVVRGSWSYLADVEMKGLGTIPVYQFGPKTISIVDTIEIAKHELESLREQSRKSEEAAVMLEQEKATLVLQNQLLQSQLTAAGETPSVAGVFEEPDEEESAESRWETIDDELDELKDLLDESAATKSDHARFLYLSMKGLGHTVKLGDERDYELMAENGYIGDFGTSQYELDEDNKLNKALLTKAKRINRMLREYVRDFPEKDEDLYDLTLTDARFWLEKLGINVN